VYNEKEITKKYLGIPFVHRGRSMDGFDCFGLIIAVYKDLGHTILDIGEYDLDWGIKGGNLFVENYHKQWEQVDAPQLFDVVLFANNKKAIVHGGIMLDNNRFLHTCKAGTVIGNLNSREWKEHTAGFFRLKK
jgi:cell wall-associated NlpC family hydrolase